MLAAKTAVWSNPLVLPSKRNTNLHFLRARTRAEPALKTEGDHVAQLTKDLEKGHQKVMIAQVAPAVRVSLGEEFGLPIGSPVRLTPQHARVARAVALTCFHCACITISRSKENLYRRFGRLDSTTCLTWQLVLTSPFSRKDPNCCTVLLTTLRTNLMLHHYPCFRAVVRDGSILWRNPLANSFPTYQVARAHI